MSPAQYPDTAATVFEWYTLSITADDLVFIPNTSGPAADRSGFSYLVCDRKSIPIPASRVATRDYTIPDPKDIYANLEKHYSTYDVIYPQKGSTSSLARQAKLIMKKKSA